MQLKDFREVWLVAFEFTRPPGERPSPIRLWAREYHSGRVQQLDQDQLARSGPPYPLGPESLFVAYDAPAQLGCHLALNWTLPARVLDLHAEFRCLTSGLDLPPDPKPAEALAYFGLTSAEPDALATLLSAMLPHVSLGHALLRGRYTAAVARMEAAGIPLDVARFEQLRREWERVQDVLIAKVDGRYGVFDGRKFNPRRWAAWVNRHGIPWPRQAPGRLDLQLDTFRDMAAVYPEVRPMKGLRATLSQLRLFGLTVGRDGRNRCPLRPFCSKTGRNQPSTSQFIFGPATWLRGLIKPGDGRALAYIDYEQQEFGIAAALSGDPAMREAYRSGDPYLTFAKQAGTVPPDATKASHRDERERFKLCALGVQYGMGARSLAVRLGVPLTQAQQLLELHKKTYSTYWKWSRQVQTQALKDGKLVAAYGWSVQVRPDSNRRSLRNFPLQANGAEMLRLACCSLTEAGVRVCAPVHDALLIEAPTEDIDRAVLHCQQAMHRASELVLPGFPLRTEVKVVRSPARYMDPRGTEMWDLVFGLLNWAEVAQCA